MTWTVLDTAKFSDYILDNVLVSNALGSVSAAYQLLVYDASKSSSAVFVNPNFGQIAQNPVSPVGGALNIALGYSYGSTSFTAANAAINDTTADIASMTVGAAGSGADVILDSLSITGSSAVTNFNISAPTGSSNCALTADFRNRLIKALFNTATDGGVYYGTNGSYTMKVYTGTMPAHGDDAATGTLLATYTGLTFGNSSGGTCAKTAITAANAVASGTGGYAEILSGTTRLMFVTVGITSSYGATLASTTFTSGSTSPAVSTMSISLP